MKECVTHHHACDCREELFRQIREKGERLESERDAAFSMSRCECASDEACRNIAKLREALDTIARVSNDPAIVTCAKHALMPNVEVQGPGAASLRTVPCNDGLGDDDAK